MPESFNLGAVAADWSPEARTGLLDFWSAEARREQIKTGYKDVTDLAAALDPRYTVTPALKLIGRSIDMVLTRPRHNLLVTMPPREGKSHLCSVVTPLRALQLNPNCRIILATYADALATEHSQMCRDMITAHGAGVIDPISGAAVEDLLGFKLAAGQNRINTWRIHGAKGGMVAVGIGGPLTGRGADLLIIDDPFKNEMEADSANHRRKVLGWFNSVAQTRLSRTASMILIQTRWHPEDLAGHVIADTTAASRAFKTWRYLNIPAISEDGIPDMLGRAEAGEAMDSWGGRTLADFNATRRAVGERTWYAMYQGSPRNPAGGLFERAWFEPPADCPEFPVATVVAIDPADTGENDATGIIAAALAPNGEIVFTEDWSGQFTSDQWGRRAVKLALEVGAREIALEAYSTATTYEAVLKRAYRTIHQETVTKARAGVQLSDIEMRSLSELPPFTIYKWRAGSKVDAVGRSALLRQALETRRARVVEDKMAQLVDDAADWQPGQHQPDRVAAAVIAHDRLAALAGGRMTVATPINTRPDPVARMLPGYTPSPWARSLRR